MVPILHALAGREEYHIALVQPSFVMMVLQVHQKKTVPLIWVDTQQEAHWITTRLPIWLHLLQVIVRAAQGVIV